MQSLYNEDIYPDQVREMILESGQIGMEIANRWMIGWPKRVVNLLIQLIAHVRQFLVVLEYQIRVSLRLNSHILRRHGDAAAGSFLLGEFKLDELEEHVQAVGFNQWSIELPGGDRDTRDGCDDFIAIRRLRFHGR